jgi:hypothetical protein
MDQTVERNSVAVPEDDRLRHLDNLSEILEDKCKHLRVT